jgi:hypothetical protein
MKRSLLRNIISLAASLAIILSITQVSSAYSVLTHQAIIDAAWDDSIRPLLLKRFPSATADQLLEAHAYAYGGSIIQDMGYYPFGSKFFTDLAHYVRSGDFIESLIRESKDVNEYAFALGALAHHAADNEGHSMAVNHAVPILYPKLLAKYGSEVTYDEASAAHIKTEFGFDVLQVARGRYASEDYRDFIGFKVSKPVLERALKATYAIELKDVFTDLDLAIGTYRRASSVVIPQMARVAWETKKDEIEKLTPGMTREKFVYNLPLAGYEKEWGGQYEKPGFCEKALACFLSVIPKVGPFKALAFKPPTPEVERMFIASLDATLDRYRESLRQTQTGSLDLSNENLDTGRPTRAGEYGLADETYAKLLDKLASRDFNNATPELRENILTFYSNLNAAIATKRDKSDWRKTVRAVDKLKTMQAQVKQ